VHTCMVVRGTPLDDKQVRGTPLDDRKVHGKIHDGRHIPARDPHLASPRWKRKRIPPGIIKPATSW